MDKIEKIRQELERRMKIYKESNYGISLRYQELKEILSFLDTLSEEPDKSLEEAAEELFETIEIQEHENIFEDTFKKIFIAGAEWQARQLLQGSPMPEDTVLFNKGVAEGRRLEREDMLKDAIHYVVQDDLDSHGASYNIPFIRIGMVALKPKGIGVGDKVQIIVVKDGSK